MRKLLFIIVLLILITIVASVYAWDKKQDVGLAQTAERQITKHMRISSPVFENEQMIPAKYTCDGENISPPLLISDVSNRARSLVIIVEDPDAPSGIWVHWLVWNLPVATSEIAEGVLPPQASEGTTSFGNTGYGGPCPPEGKHRYIFKLYALGGDLYLDKSATVDDLKKAMETYVIETAELTGVYARSN